jgi:HAD superfamily hydrolase (TIGR01509 family)
MGLGIAKLVSGGQTGADRAALDFAIEHEIPHGGWCPADRLAEDGPIPSQYNLSETPSSAYAERTEWNVRDSDGTVVFSIEAALKGGTKETTEFAMKYGKPVLHLSRIGGPATPETELLRFIRDNQIRTLNVAGPRASAEPEIAGFVREVLKKARAAGQIRAVIFDMDGVLTDSEPLINAAAIAMFNEKGLVVQPEDFSPFVGTGEDRYIGGVAEKYHFPLNLPSAKSRTYEIYLELVPKQLNAFPGAPELVQACRQARLQVAVASSADRVKIKANLRKIGLPPESWDALVWGEEVRNKKPAPDIFLAAAAKLKLTPGQCVVVEDAVNGVESAKAAGMRCIAVAQTFSPDRLQKANLVRRNLLEVSVVDLAGDPAAKWE